MIKELFITTIFALTPLKAIIENGVRYNDDTTNNNIECQASYNGASWEQQTGDYTIQWQDPYTTEFTNAAANIEGIFFAQSIQNNNNPYILDEVIVLGVTTYINSRITPKFTYSLQTPITGTATITTGTTNQFGYNAAKGQTLNTLYSINQYQNDNIQTKTSATYEIETESEYTHTWTLDEQGQQITKYYYLRLQFEVQEQVQGWAGTLEYLKIDLNYTIIQDINVTQEIVNIPDIMFQILGMPFTFMSIAFNLDLFPGTEYHVNISALLLTLLGIIILIIILKKFVGK